MSGSIEWAKEALRQLRDEIRTLSARSRSRLHAVEELGLVPEQDHLQDLRRRLGQVERLIEAETGPDIETGWPAHLGDPSTTGAGGAATKNETRRPT